MARPSDMSGVTKPWLFATGLWFACILLVTWWNVRAGTHYTVCLFKNITDIPCPGCGGTRAALALARGQLSAAFSFNPLASAVLLLSPLIIFAWIRNQKQSLDQRWRPGRIFWITISLLVFANWIYLVETLP